MLTYETAWHVGPDMPGRVVGNAREDYEYFGVKLQIVEAPRR